MGQARKILAFSPDIAQAVLAATKPLDKALEQVVAEQAEGNKALAAEASSVATDAEASAKDAAAKTAIAKDRLDRLAKGTYRADCIGR